MYILFQTAIIFPWYWGLVQKSHIVNITYVLNEGLSIVAITWRHYWIIKKSRFSGTTFPKQSGFFLFLHRTSPVRVIQLYAVLDVEDEDVEMDVVVADGLGFHLDAAG